MKNENNGHRRRHAAEIKRLPRYSCRHAARRREARAPVRYAHGVVYVKCIKLSIGRRPTNVNERRNAALDM